MDAWLELAGRNKRMDQTKKKIAHSQLTQGELMWQQPQNKRTAASQHQQKTTGQYNSQRAALASASWQNSATAGVHNCCGRKKEVSSAKAISAFS